MEVRKYVRILLHGWWVIVLATLVVGVAVAIFTTQQERVYSSQTTLVISPQASLTSTNEIISALNILDKRSIIITYSTILGSDISQRKAFDTVGVSNEQRRSVNVIVTAVSEANALRITVEAHTQELAAQVANSLADQAVVELSQLYPIYTLGRMDSASMSNRPIRPSQEQAVLGIPIGLALGIAFVLVMNYVGVHIPTIPPRQQAEHKREVHAIFTNTTGLMQSVEQELKKIPAGDRNLAFILVDLTHAGETLHVQRAIAEHITVSVPYHEPANAASALREAVGSVE